MTAPLPATGHGALCQGRTKRGTLCELPAGFGTSHVGVGRCKFHLGSTETHVVNGSRRLAEGKVRRSLDEVGIREVDNPLDELRRLTGEVVAWKDHTATHVAALDGELTLLLEGEEIGDKTLIVTEQIKAVVPLYERALDRAGKFLEMWARLGIDAMLATMTVRLNEAQMDAMGRGLEAYRTAAEVEEPAHQAGLAAMAKTIRGK